MADHTAAVTDDEAGHVVRCIGELTTDLIDKGPRFSTLNAGAAVAMNRELTTTSSTRVSFAGIRDLFKRYLASHSNCCSQNQIANLAVASR